tara:strand:- start:729 stop:2639 length:1911 start_codon:yes stop_codon:yes gene_type:complete
MKLTKVQFKPGINRENTNYSNEGGWFDGNLVRFKKGLPEKIGGWRKDNSNTFLGNCRALHGWTNLTGTKFLGLGTTSKYYVEKGGSFYDITPLRQTTAAGDVTFSATDGSSTVTATDSNHGLSAGDYVSFSGATSFGGNITADVINQEGSTYLSQVGFLVTAVTGVNTYTFTVPVTANSSDAGSNKGGSSVIGYYQIQVGLDAYVSGTGWGAGAWGAGAFGSTSPLAFANQLRSWSHDNFGEDLIINPRNGGIYYWDSSGGVEWSTSSSNNRAKNITELANSNLAPTVGLFTLVSQVDRHVIVLGADPLNASGTARTSVQDPLFIAFCDQENITEWEPKSTNTAGSLSLSEGSTIVGAVKARQEILVWTDTSLYSMQFIGPPFTFGVNLINKETGLIGPKAAVVSSAGVFWMSYDSFYVYSGSVQKVPCSVLSYVFDDLNISEAYKFHAFINEEFDEVGWYYTSASGSEIDRYVSYNYANGAWAYGQLSRTAWLDAGVEPYPRATSGGYLYEHEVGYDNDGSPMTNVFIESSDLDIEDGDEFSFVSKLIPDVRFLSNADGGQINFVLKTRNAPGESLTTKSTSVINGDTARVDLRSRSRQIALRFESDDDATYPGNNNTGWRLGSNRLQIKPNGRR